MYFYHFLYQYILIISLINIIIFLEIVTVTSTVCTVIVTKVNAILLINNYLNCIVEVN